MSGDVTSDTLARSRPPTAGGRANSSLTAASPASTIRSWTPPSTRFRRRGMGRDELTGPVPGAGPSGQGLSGGLRLPKGRYRRPVRRGRLRRARSCGACCRRGWRGRSSPLPGRGPRTSRRWRAVRSGIGLPFGFLRRMRLSKPAAARCASFFAGRSASPLSLGPVARQRRPAQTPLAVLVRSISPGSSAPSCRAASVAVRVRISPWRRSIPTWFL